MNTTQKIGVIGSVISLFSCIVAPAAGIIALLVSLLVFAVGRMLSAS